MLRFYYQTLSLYSRPVWITLLEKQLTFEPIELTLNGDQWQPEFLAINPFGRVPVLVDDGFTIFESLAILDYLELQYPNPAFLPDNIKSLTIVRAIEMLALHELIPAMQDLIRTTEKNSRKRAYHQIFALLDYLEKHLGNKPYIAGDRLSQAEIVAGSLILWLPYLDVTLSNHPQVESWSERLMQRSAWRETQPAPEIMGHWFKRIQKLPKVRARQWKHHQISN